jgi:hypothetical protein
MKNTNIPLNNDLPSMGKLIKSTILAIGIATVLLVTVVLPAEYGIDPLGFGKMIGLAKMGEIKTSLAQEAAIEKQSPTAGSVTAQEEKSVEVVSEESAPEPQADLRSDKITLTLKPNEGKEIKLTMTKESTVNYLWYTDRGVASFDAHADSKKLNIKYHSYDKGKLAKDEGTMEAAFDGNHGWFWRNRTQQTMTVTLEVNGSYSDVLQF